MFVFLWWWWTWLSGLINIFFEVGIKDIIVLDSNKSQITESLEKKWIKVIIWDGIYNFQKEDIIIYSDAVLNSKDFSKISENRKMSYFEFLWEISKWFQTISIAWTHGKTSTTWMSIYLAKQLNFAEIWIGIVWWLIPDFDNKNYFINKDKKSEIKKILETVFQKKWNKPTEEFKKLYFFLEADEFNRHFLLLDSYISLITCLDHDHQEVYRTQQEYDEAFEIFRNKTRDRIFEKWKIEKSSINFKYIFWEYMQENASLVVALFEYLWFKKEEIEENLKFFKWIWRRQEFLWKIWNLKIYTDYAHHPTEINATFEAFSKQFTGEKVIWIFQAHQINRLKSYETGFIESLNKFDEIIVYDIYSAREEDLIKQITGESGSLDEIKFKIWNKLAKDVKWIYVENFEELLQKLQNREWTAVLLTAWDLDYKMRNFMLKK